MRAILWSLPFLLAVSGCLDHADVLVGQGVTTTTPASADHCGQVQRRSDGAWLLPTVRASATTPLWAANAGSRLDARWREAYAVSACQMTTAYLKGETPPPQPWLGPVLRTGEVDEIVVTFENNLQRTVDVQAWANVSGSAVRVEPGSWSGQAPPGTSQVTLRVTGLSEGKSGVTIEVATPAAPTTQAGGADYVVNDTAGAPHRLD